MLPWRLGGIHATMLGINVHRLLTSHQASFDLGFPGPVFTPTALEEAMLCFIQQEFLFVWLFGCVFIIMIIVVVVVVILRPAWESVLPPKHPWRRWCRQGTIDAMDQKVKSRTGLDLSSASLVSRTRLHMSVLISLNLLLRLQFFLPFFVVSVCFLGFQLSWGRILERSYPTVSISLLRSTWALWGRISRQIHTGRCSERWPCGEIPAPTREKNIPGPISQCRDHKKISCC